VFSIPTSVPYYFWLSDLFILNTPAAGRRRRRRQVGQYWSISLEYLEEAALRNYLAPDDGDPNLSTPKAGAIVLIVASRLRT